MHEQASAARQTILPPPIRKEIRVRLDPAAAFSLFVELDHWWPRSMTSHPGGGVGKIIFEARPGGRWAEVGSDGTLHDVGRVIAVEPGSRLLIDWQLDGDSRYDPNLHTDLEFTFRADGEGTLVTLEHRDMERFGHQAERRRALLDGGWPIILAAFAAAGA